MGAIKIITESKKSYQVDLAKNLTEGTINDQDFNWDVIEVKNNSFSVIKDHQSYNVEVLNVIPEEKSFLIKVNGLKYQMQAKDKYDELLHSLGMDNLATKKVSDLKAPMPGLVFDIIVSEGQEVKKGNALLILEAMKMENMIKSPTDGVIKSIEVEKGVAVEKNQVLLNFA